jgi:hypothetical protein
MPLTQPLREFQRDFAQALQVGETDGPTTAVLTAQPGFAVYRNTVMKGCIDALAANYPAVVRLVGDDWFRAAAAVFAQAHPPLHPMLVDYGRDFPRFLSAFEPAAELTYLADVAQLDRFWTEAHIAFDETPLAAGALANLAPAALASTVLRPHASARWKSFAQQPIFSLWRCNRDGSNTDALSTLAWRGESVLLVRPHSTVDAIELSLGGCAFLDVCGAGASLADAGAAALGAERDVDLAALMAQLLQAGAFAEITQ